MHRRPRPTLVLAAPLLATALITVGCDEQPTRAPADMPGSGDDDASPAGSVTPTRPPASTDASVRVETQPADAGMDGAAGTTIADGPGTGQAAPDAGADAQAMAPDGSVDLGAAPDSRAVAQGGPSRCGTGGFPICLGFEDRAIPPAWTVYRNKEAGEPVVASGETARGGWALHLPRLDYGNSSPQAGIRSTTLGNLGPVLWGRVFLRFGPSAPQNPGGLVTATDQDDNVFEVGFDGGSYRAGWRTAAADPRTTGSRSRTPLPIGRWDCVELFFDGAGGTPIRLFSDGVEVTGYNKPLAIPAKVSRWKSLQVGYHTYHKVPMAEVWYDELAFDQRRIGCDR